MGEKMQIDYNYEPYPCQYKLHKLVGSTHQRQYEVCGESKYRKRLMTLVAHRRMGKTTFGINHCIMDAIAIDTEKREQGKPRYALVYPERQQGKSVAWDLLKENAKDLPGYEKNESELFVEFFNGAKIYIAGADDEDRLRGHAWDGLILDEYKDINPEVWTDALFPATMDNKGWAVLTGTAGGHNHFYDAIKENSKSDLWNTVVMPANEHFVNEFTLDKGIKPNYLESTNVFNEDELKMAKEVMKQKPNVKDVEAAYRREFGCQFQSAIPGAYYDDYINRARREEDNDPSRITNVPYEEKVPVHTAWDLGISDMTAIWFVQRVNKEIRLIDYVQDQDQPLKHYFNILKQKPYSYGRHIAPHDIEVREMISGRSRKELAREHGVNFTTIEKTDVDDRIAAVRSILEQCWFDKNKCKEGIHALEEYHREQDDEGTFKDKPVHNWASHGADAFGYLAQGLDRYITNDRSGETEVTTAKTDWDLW